MADRPEPDDPQASVRRLIDLIQVLIPTLRPAVVHAIERCVRELVVDQMRQRITDRVAGLSADDLVTVDVLTAQLTQAEPPPADDEAT